MADTSGQALIRGIDINKVATGYADEALVLQNMIRNSPTSNRELRYYVKTAGFLDSTDTTAITASQIYNTAEGALPVVVEQSWTRNTAYVKLYKVESPWINIEDIKDNDVDIWSTHLKDLVLSVKNQVDVRILSVVGDVLGTGGNVNTAAATGNGWDDATNGNPIYDILNGEAQIRSYRYDPSGAILYMHPTDYRNLMNWLIVVKGSSIPDFSSKMTENGVVYSVLGHMIKVSVNMSADTVIMFVPDCAVWRSFMALSSFVIDNPGIAQKVRVIEEGECILEHPRKVHVITDTIT